MVNRASSVVSHDSQLVVDRLFRLVANALVSAVLAFIYISLLMDVLGFGGKSRDVGLFFVSSLLLPPIVAFYLLYIEKSWNDDFGSSIFESMHFWLATVALTAFAVLALQVSAATVPFITWSTGAKGLSIAIFGINSVALVGILFLESWLGAQPSWVTDRASIFRNSQVQITCFSLALIVALLLMFFIPEKAGTTHPFIGVFTEPRFNGAGGLYTILSHIAAVLIVGLSIRLAVVESRLINTNSERLLKLRVCGLVGAIALVSVLFFDFSLPSEALHFITNVAPALQLRHGGTLLIDTFSQYGPGPVLMTLAALYFGPDTLSSANLVVQFHNIAFFAVWLVCLYRLSRFKMPALVIGVAMIAILLAVWGIGYSNINFAPSILGFRYLPSLLMVLAISCLPTISRNSIWTALTAFLATSWSIEAFAGTIGIQLAFIGMLGLHDRKWRRLIGDGFIALIPVSFAIAAMATYTMLRAGDLPHYQTYFGYLGIYNLFSTEWSLTANSKFFGWAGIFLIVFLGLAEAWYRIFKPSSVITLVKTSTLYYKVLPMLLLCLITSLYFVGRSVEYTLILALLPAAAIAVPAILYISPFIVAQKRSWAYALLGVPVVVFIVGLSFSLNSLSRVNGPYSFYLHECRDLDRCTPAALFKGLNQRLHLRSVLEKSGNGFIDSYYDPSGAIRETVKMLKQLEPERSKVTVLLGPVRNIPIVRDIRDQIASDYALLYAGKWHTWPRSATFTDEMLPNRIKQILDAPVKLQAGDFVFVRKLEDMLGPIEAGILKIIREAFILCLVPSEANEINVYRLSNKSVCL